MYGALALFDGAGRFEKGKRVYIGASKARNEAWLRDTLFNHPEIIPVNDVDTAFGPLLPLCTELRTDAGLIDAVFINEQGRLTIIECKLWKNPQARREVVAQTLDYVSALSGWSYADLQRQVSAALGRRGNIPFELVRKHAGDKPEEPAFVDAVSRSLREGRFLVLLVGDGIREGVQSLTELVNRNASKAFTFGIIEAAVYQFGGSRFAIQPRLLAKTEIVKREMTVFTMKDRNGSAAIDNSDNDGSTEPTATDRSRDKSHLRAWWRPILNMKFDDPEQEPPRWIIPNNVALLTPYPGIHIRAYAVVTGDSMAVYVTGSEKRLGAIQGKIAREKKFLRDLLPVGTIVDPNRSWPFVLQRDELLPDTARYVWLKKTLNDFANVLRPRLRKWYEEFQKSDGG